MNWEISWADMCRACMEVEGVLLPLYDDDGEISENDLPSKLAEVTSIQVSFCPSHFFVHLRLTKY
jgi:hypothetical protein